MEANGVWDLGLQGMDFGVLFSSTRGGVDAIFRGVESKTGCEESDVCAGDGGA